MNRFAERFLHVDMDAFFVEVERLHDAELRGRAVVVGGLGPRGVVASASYEARRRGVRSAMPMAEARRRAPQARFVAPSHDRYAAVSDEVFTVLRRFTPLVESLSIDEAFLDIAGLRLHYETPAAVGAVIRHGIRSDVGIPSSVGIATSKFIAKTASEKAKPDGMRVIAAGEELAFLHPLPIGDLWGVGEATQAALESLGVATIGDLAVTSEVTLRRRLGPAVGGHLAALARGEDDRFVTPEASARSISVEETYPQDVSATEAVERELLRLCDRLAGRLRRSGYGGKTITLKVRFADFTTVTRSGTVPDPLFRRPDLWEEGRKLLGRARPDERPIRLLGVGVSGLVGIAEPEQLSLTHRERDRVADAAEKVRSRFGDRAVMPARLLDSPTPRPLKEGSEMPKDSKKRGES
jgi:DNA polymerase-4